MMLENDKMSEVTDLTTINSNVVTHDVGNVVIENYDFERFIALFNKIELNISNYWLVNIGVNQLGEKKMVYLIIRAFSTKPFFGPHLVSLYTHTEGEAEPRMVTIWVHSLTFLRKELFLFQDRLSFERSTFLAPFKDNLNLIRLKSIRGFITIPFAALTEPTVPCVSPRKQRSRDRINQLLNKNIQMLITFMSRECNLSMRESVCEIATYTNYYCTQLIQNFT